MALEKKVDREYAERSKLSFLGMIRAGESDVPIEPSKDSPGGAEGSRYYAEGKIAETTHYSLIKHEEGVSNDKRSVTKTRFMIGPSNSYECVYAAKVAETNASHQFKIEQVDTGEKVLRAVHEPMFGQGNNTTLVGWRTKETGDMYIYQQLVEGEKEKIGTMHIDGKAEEIRQSTVDREFIEGYRVGSIGKALENLSQYISDSYSGYIGVIELTVKAVKVRQKSTILMGNGEELDGGLVQESIMLLEPLAIYNGKSMSFTTPLNMNSPAFQFRSYAKKVLAANAEDVISTRPILEHSQGKRGEDDLGYV